MYKDKEKQKKASSEAVRRFRGKGITQGITKEGITGEGITSYPDIIDKLTDSFWRPRLEKICHAFKSSHHPDYAHDVTVGVYGVDLGTACDLLEVTG